MRRFAELLESVAVFLSQSAADHVYWIERSGKTQKNLALNAAPIDVAEYLRHRLFGADTSVVMTSATLGTRVGQASRLPGERAGASGERKRTVPASPTRAGETPALLYFVRKVGAERAVQLQVGSPFDYERQMELVVVHKMPDPSEASY